MKPSRSVKNLLGNSAFNTILISVPFFCAPSVYATDGTWTNSAVAAGNWSDTTKWTGTIIADGVGSTANFNIDYGTNNKVATVNTTSRTVGTLNIGDSTAGFFSVTINASGGASLIFNNSGSGALLAKTTVGNTVADVISAPVTLADDLAVNMTDTTVNGTAGSFVRIAGVISETGGARSITKIGDGVMQLGPIDATAGPVSTYTGGFTLNAGGVHISGNSVFGAGILTINGGRITSRGGSRAPANPVVVGGDFTLNGALTVANNNTLTLAGTVDLGGSIRTISVGAEGGAVIAGAISNGGLTKAGAPTLTLSGASSYSGPTTVSAGTLNLTGSISGTSVSVAAGTTFTESADGVISGSSTFMNSGTSTLGGINTYTGATVVNGGTLTLSAFNPIDLSSGVSINGSGAKLVLSGFGTVVPPVTLTNGLIDGNGAINLLTVGNSAGNTLSAGNGAASSLQVGTLTFQGAATVNMRATGSSSDQYLTTTNLVTSPVAHVVIDATNTTGAWTAGTDYPVIDFSTYTSVPDASHFTLGTVAGLNPSQTAKLVKTGTSIVLRITSQSLVWTGLQNSNWTTTPVGGSRNWTQGGSPIEFTSNRSVIFDDTASTFSINLAQDITAGVVEVSNTFGNDYTFSSVSGKGLVAGNLIKSGDAKLTIQTNSTITGSTTIAGGTLELTGAASIAGSPSVTNNGFLILNTDASPDVYANPITGTGSVAKQGTGTLTLSGGNTFSGDFMLEDGLLNFNSASALGSGAGSIIINGGSLDNTSGSDVVATINKAQTWNADIVFSGSHSLDMGSRAVTLGGLAPQCAVTVNSGTLAVGEIKGATQGLDKRGAGTVVFTSSGAGNAASVLGGILTVSGGTVQINRTGDAAGGDFTATGLAGTGTITNGAAIERWLLVNTTDTETFGGTLANGGTGALGLNKQGAGTLTLTGSSTYTGITTVTGGILDVRNSNALGSGLVTIRDRAAALQLQGGITIPNNFVTSNDGTGATGYAIANLNGNNTISGTISLTDGGGNTVILSDTGSLTLAGNVTNGHATSGRTLILQGSSTGANIVSGVISNGVPATLVTKNDSGTWILSGANTYTGTTTVNAGTLVISGDSSAATGAVTVASGATLGGSGNLGGAVTIGSGAHQAIAIAATQGAQATRTITGSLTLTAGNILDLTAATTPASGTYTLVTANGGIVGTPTTVNLAGVTGTVSVAGNSLILTVGGSPYSSWASSKGLTEANNGATVDAESDGLRNLLEFVLGGNPLAFDTGILPALTTDATNYIFTFFRADESESEIGLKFQYGSALAGWTDVAVGSASAPANGNGVVVSVMENGASPDTVVITVPKTNAVGSKLFGRLNAVK